MGLFGRLGRWKDDLKSTTATAGEGAGGDGVGDTRVDDGVSLHSIRGGASARGEGDHEGAKQSDDEDGAEGQEEGEEEEERKAQAGAGVPAGGGAAQEAGEAESGTDASNHGSEASRSSWTPLPPAFGLLASGGGASLPPLQPGDVSPLVSPAVGGKGSKRWAVSMSASGDAGVGSSRDGSVSVGDHEGAVVVFQLLMQRWELRPWVVVPRTLVATKEQVSTVSLASWVVIRSDEPWCCLLRRTVSRRLVAWEKADTLVGGHVLLRRSSRGERPCSRGGDAKFLPAPVLVDCR